MTRGDECGPARSDAVLSAPPSLPRTTGAIAAGAGYATMLAVSDATGDPLLALPIAAVAAVVSGIAFDGLVRAVD